MYFATHNELEAHDFLPAFSQLLRLSGVICFTALSGVFFTISQHKTSYMMRLEQISLENTASVVLEKEVQELTDSTDNCFIKG